MAVYLFIFGYFYFFTATLIVISHYITHRITCMYLQKKLYDVISFFYEYCSYLTRLLHCDLHLGRCENIKLKSSRMYYRSCNQQKSNLLTVMGGGEWIKLFLLKSLPEKYQHHCKMSRYIPRSVYNLKFKFTVINKIILVFILKYLLTNDLFLCFIRLNKLYLINLKR